MSLKVKIIIFILIIVALIIISIIIAKKVKKAKIARDAAKNYNESFVTGNTGGQAYSFNGATVASEVYNALHYDCMWGACEYEGAAVSAINNVPKAFMKVVNDAWNKEYQSKVDGRTLQQDLKKYLSEENWNAVRSQFM